MKFVFDVEFYSRTFLFVKIFWKLQIYQKHTLFWSFFILFNLKAEPSFFIQFGCNLVQAYYHSQQSCDY